MFINYPINLIKILLFFLFVSCVPQLFAKDEHLVVGISHFYPPFVIQGAHNVLYGYDVDMINELCRIMQRKCVFKCMRFRELIPAIVDEKIDMAVNAIAITPERMKKVNFSMPYLLSYSRFLTNNSYKNIPFSIQLLNGKRIGVGRDSIFNQEIRTMDIVNPTIVTFSGIHSSEEMLESLSQKKIDFVLMDNPSALYWEANSSGDISAIGSPILYGLGLGIALNQHNTALLKMINNALLQYHYSNIYIYNYNSYLVNLK